MTLANNMMRIQILIFFLCLSGCANAAVLSEGSNIDDVTAAMKADNYKEGGGHIIVPGKKFGFKFWSVDEGTLIIAYDKVTRKVRKLVYHLADERDHDIRKEFRFDVKQFESTQGLLTLAAKKIQANKP